jgi:hypothetical protein
MESNPEKKIKITNEEQSKAYSISCSREPLDVKLNGLSFKRCSPDDNMAKYSIIKYLQSDAEHYLLENKPITSFWLSLSAILHSWNDGDMHIMVDSENNIYGYVLGNNKDFYHKIGICAIETIHSYRNKKVGKLMVLEWEKLCIINGKNNVEDNWDGYVFIYPQICESIPFWMSLGYNFFGEQRDILRKNLITSCASLAEE